MNALTYFGDEVILKYLYNGEDILGTQRNQDDPIPNYSSFTLELVRDDGSLYTEGEQNTTLIRAFDTESWSIIGGIVTNTNDIEFPPNGEDFSQNIVTANLYVDGFEVNRQKIATITLNTPITVQKGETPIIRAYNASSGDGLEIDIDATNKYTSTFKQKINEYLFLADDSLNGISSYRFTIIDNTGSATSLSVDVSRDSQFPNWDLVLFGSGSSGYSQMQNDSDLEFGLYEGNASINTNTFDMFYEEGFPNPIFTKAGRLSMTQVGNDTTTTYQILNGETARFKAGELRINAK